MFQDVDVDVLERSVQVGALRSCTLHG
jgi:hypothetical protein